MQYHIRDIARDIRIAIDQNAEGRPLRELGDSDQLTLDEIVASNIEPAAAAVMKAAPYTMLELGHLLPTDVMWGDMGSGWVMLPRDFMRLVVFEMSDWERPVYNPITPADPLYARQRSRWAGVRGTAQRPVVAIVTRQEGLALEFYSCKSEDAEVAKGAYVAWPRTDRDGWIDISQLCYRAMVCKAAALTCLAVGEAERAQAFEALCQQELTI